jgi:23S rRNA (uracil1939-C5)-methyltransferase
VPNLPYGCEIACPACAYRDLPPEESRARKEAFLARELSGVGVSPESLREPGSRWNYRRKALLHARLNSGAWALGMIKRRGREEEFVPIPSCPAHDPFVNELFAWAAAHVPASWPLSFALVSGRALTLVLKTKRQPDYARAMAAWAGFPGASLYVNWNPGAGNRALDSRRTELISGEEWLEEDGVRHGPVAFRQQIPELAAAAVAEGEAFLEGAGVNVGVDLYCGLGTSLRRWRGLGWEAAGVELSGESLAAAAVNAPGALLLRGRSEERLPQLDAFVDGRPFVLYTNPPREGQGPAVNAWVRRALPERIAYLSCNPRTLGNDLRELAGAYEITRVVPFDFFPPTPHVEALALLKRRG